MRYLLLLLGVLLTCAQLPAQDMRRPMVVMISIDGLRPEYVLHADSLGLAVPHLRRLVAEGAHATGVVGVTPTVTYPSHTTLLTGAHPARHGVYGNTTFDPEQRNQGGWYWYASDIRVPTLWDAARARGLITANVHWPVSVGAPVDYNLPQYWRTGMPDDRKLLRALSTPGLFDRMERALGPYADGIDESISGDENRARFAVRLIEEYAPSFVTAYFTALDHEQHEQGPLDARNAKAKAVLERIDAVVGSLVAAARRAAGDSATIVVVSDHGFASTHTEINLIPVLGREGLIQLDSTGRIAAWTVGLWSNGATVALQAKQPGDPVLARRLQELARALTADSALGVERAILPRDIAAAGAFPSAEMVIYLRPGYTAGTRATGPVARPAAVRGMHGHTPALGIMRSSFFAAGRGVTRGLALGDVDMRAIAPTVARLLDLHLPGAEAAPLPLGRGAAVSCRTPNCGRR